MIKGIPDSPINRIFLFINVALYFMSFTWPWSSETCSTDRHCISLVHNCPPISGQFSHGTEKSTFAPLGGMYPKWRLKSMLLSVFYCLMWFKLNIIFWCLFQQLIRLGECAVEHCICDVHIPVWTYEHILSNCLCEKKQKKYWTYTALGIFKLIELVLLLSDTYSWKHLQVLSKPYKSEDILFDWL